MISEKMFKSDQASNHNFKSQRRREADIPCTWQS